MDLYKNFSLKKEDVEEQRNKFGSNRLTEKKTRGILEKIF